MTGVILGNPNSVFVYRQAKFFIESGISIKILTYHNGPDKVNIIDSGIDYDLFVETITIDDFWLSKLNRIGKGVERRISKFFKWNRENILEHLLLAFATRRTLKKIHPDFIFGHNLVSYGIPICLAPNKIRKYVFPYGGDVFYIDTHPLRYRILKALIGRVNKIFPTAEYGKRVLLEKFKIDPNVIDVVSLGVNLGRFQPENKKIDQAFIMKYLNIHIEGDYDIILNIRRFRPKWGSLEALEVAKKLIALRQNVIYIFIGGSGSDQEIKIESNEGLSPLERERIKFLDDRVPEDIFTRIINCCTVFTSLLKVEDMRSSSILEGLAAGSVPVVTKCEEYKHMEELGFRPVYVSLDINEIVNEINLLLDDKTKMRQIINDNLAYVNTYEDSEVQLNLLLQKISICQGAE
jgi:glycosyltransferase involved in cell wall biosynthesis